MKTYKIFVFKILVSELLFQDGDHNLYLFATLINKIIKVTIQRRDCDWHFTRSSQFAYFAYCLDMKG